MSLQLVNVGNVINDGTGDDLYSAFVKINENFQQLDFIHGQNNTASNVGTGVGLYKEKIGSDLRFKTLVAGPGISLTTEATDIVINNVNTSIKTITGDTGSYTANSLSSTMNFRGVGHIVVTLTGNTITIADDNRLVLDTNPQLGGNLDLNGHNIVGTGNVTATHLYGPLTGNVVGNVTGDVTGNVTGLVNNIDITELARDTRTFDFGSIIPTNIDDGISFLDWLRANLMIDMGTFADPKTRFTPMLGEIIDGGTVPPS